MITNKGVIAAIDNSSTMTDNLHDFELTKLVYQLVINWCKLELFIINIVIIIIIIIKLLLNLHRPEWMSFQLTDYRVFF